MASTPKTPARWICSPWNSWNTVRGPHKAIPKRSRRNPDEIVRRLAHTTTDGIATGPDAAGQINKFIMHAIACLPLIRVASLTLKLTSASTSPKPTSPCCRKSPGATLAVLEESFHQPVNLQGGFPMSGLDGRIVRTTEDLTCDMAAELS